MRARKDYDYYIFLDYSEDLIGYNIIERDSVAGLLPKISKLKHYKGSRNRKLYIKHLKNSIEKNKIGSYFEKVKIVEIRKNMDLFLEILEFVKKNNNCVIFISVDDYQYRCFARLMKMTDGDKVKMVKESKLKKDSGEYRLSLVIDNLLNIERRRR